MAQVLTELEQSMDRYWNIQISKLDRDETAQHVGNPVPPPDLLLDWNEVLHHAVDQINDQLWDRGFRGVIRFRD